MLDGRVHSSRRAAARYHAGAGRRVLRRRHRPRRRHHFITLLFPSALPKSGPRGAVICAPRFFMLSFAHRAPLRVFFAARLFDARYITPRDTERFCDLPLRAGHPAAETVARGDDLLLALSQTLRARARTSRQSSRSWMSRYIVSSTPTTSRNESARRRHRNRANR